MRYSFGGAGFPAGAKQAVAVHWVVTSGQPNIIRQNSERTEQVALSILFFIDKGELK